MVALTERVQRRLTVETGAIAADTTTIRCLDWDRDRFDDRGGYDDDSLFGLGSRSL